MTSDAALAMVTVAERPDLAPTVSRWIWDAFAATEGLSLQQAEASMAEAAAGRALPATFVLLSAGHPVGTASLVAQDLDARPDLTPWLASVVVAPEARGRGHVYRLVAAVEAAARRAAVPRLWLYTRTAERLYAKAGWSTIGPFAHRGEPHVLMTKPMNASV